MLKVTNDHYGIPKPSKDRWEHEVAHQVYVTDETGTTWRIEKANGGLQMTPIENAENQQRGMVTIIPVGHNCVRIKAAHSDNAADPNFTGEAS